MRTKLILLLLFFSAFQIHSQNNILPDIPYDSIFSRYSKKVPGVVMMVVKDDSILVRKFYGEANIEFRFPSRFNTNYRMASVSKQFTAMAVLQLINKDLLNFKSTLTDIFPEFPEYGKKITVKQLLTHTSGLLDYENLMSDNRKNPILDREVLQLLEQQDSVKFKPGTKYEYSNSGYAILAQIVEKISGMPYPEYMKKNIFEPLGMDNSLIYTKKAKIKNRAFGYTIRDDGRISFTDQSMTSAVQGDGGVYTSLKDYFLWTKALKNNTLIPKKLQKKVWSPQYYNKQKKEGYGFGWRIKFIGKTRIVSHSGHTVGFTNYVVKIPKKDLTVVLFSNRNNDDTVLRIGDYLLAVFSENSVPIPALDLKENTDP